MTMEEYANKFLDIMRYVKYIKVEKIKIQFFLSGHPQSYKYINDFDEPIPLHNSIRKDKQCYYHNKSKLEFNKAWKDNKNERPN